MQKCHAPYLICGAWLLQSGAELAQQLLRDRVGVQLRPGGLAACGLGGLQVRQHICDFGPNEADDVQSDIFAVLVQRGRVMGFAVRVDAADDGCSPVNSQLVLAVGLGCQRGAHEQHNLAPKKAIHAPCYDRVHVAGQHLVGSQLLRDGERLAGGGSGRRVRGDIFCHCSKTPIASQSQPDANCTTRHCTNRQ